ncbi:hypothetical protein [Chitinophaga sp. Cy-1792]|uniref:hypothetical protein n=1 Tax=Chitinophaga sp. Cy-1792 TaxID=2608339 RepID=UPI00142450FC|nr:hypothetical protein [Chitinophaga sp. Cy-1792]NIG57403.1 hypothetical protein [Chitinophaga sp. Cy-1792]
MKTFFFAVLLVVVTIHSNAQNTKYAPAHVGLIYPISSNGKHAAEYTNGFSLNLLAGVSRSETGIAIAGFSNIIKDEAHGVEVAGFSNHIGHTYKAVTVAGFMNIVHNKADGILVAGFGNYVGGPVNGLQVAGFCNTASQVHGLQVAGFFNRATDANMQFAGFMNIAKKVKGVQLAGFLNIADSSDYPIGIINIIKNGEYNISLTIDESATTVASFKSGGKALYGILGVGYNLKSAQTLYAMQAGLGWHLPLMSHLRLNVEGTETVMTDFKRGVYSKYAVGGYLAYRLGSKVEVFAGPNINFMHMKDDAGSDLISHYIWYKDRGNGKADGMFAGMLAGVQVRI